MPSTIWITLSDEFVYILFRNLKLQELSKNWLDVLSGYNTSITLVEQFKALKGFSVSSSFLESLKPMERNYMFHEGKVNSIALVELWVCSFEFIFDVTWGHLVESEVLEDVPKESIGDNSCVFLIIIVKAFLEIVENISGEVLDCLCVF